MSQFNQMEFSTFRMLKAHFDVIQCFSLFGRNFAEVKEPQQTASETFRIFSEIHRNMERDGLKMLKAVKPVLSDLGTYLTKAIPDTKLTIRRYADAKFTYLSYCLKVKELDDEEHTYVALQDPLYRVETGNYEYRLVLRCRQDARAKFASLRNDVLEKLELLESKHAQDLVSHLRKLIEGLAAYSKDVDEKIKAHPNLFPIEVDLKPSAFQYKSNQAAKFEDDDLSAEEKISIEMGMDALSANRSDDNRQEDVGPAANLIGGFEEINLSDAKQTDSEQTSATDNLLLELGIADINLALNPVGSSVSVGTTSSPNATTAAKSQNQLLANSLDWLADDGNAFSVDDIFSAPSAQSQAVNSSANINLLD